MKKIWNGLTKDLWIVLLDILAVNFAYFLAVLVRFYIKTNYLSHFFRCHMFI